MMILKWIGILWVGISLLRKFDSQYATDLKLGQIYIVSDNTSCNRTAKTIDPNGIQ